MIVCGKEIKVKGRLVRIARLDAEKYHFVQDPEPVLAALRKSGARIDLFTFMQKLPDTSPKYAYPMEWDNFAAIPITTFEDWWNERIGFKARNKAKQAGKHGVVLKEVPFDETLVRGMWEIYNETPIRQGKRFPHYGMSLERMHEYAGTYLEDSVFIAAFLSERLIGFVKLTMDETRTQAGLMQIVSLVSERDKAPTNALVAEAVRSCAKRHIAFLVYSNFAYGNKQHDSLSDFKERSGFERMNVPRYFVPLTPLGKIALRLRLHHRLVDLLPESLMSKVRDLRTNWYSRQVVPDTAIHNKSVRGSEAS